MESSSVVSSVSPVFVVGAFRSGTSLLYTLLNQHPQIGLMYECDVWDFPRLLTRHRFRRAWLERLEFYNQVLSRHRLILGDRLRGLENIRTPDDLYRCHSGNKGAVLWGEKSPLYAARLATLCRRYPQASFILIWRDPLEIYRSIQMARKKSAFFNRPGQLHRLIHDKEKMVRQAAELEAAGARVHHVCYDDLVDDTSGVCRGICRFLQIDFDPRMTGLEQADFSAVYNAPQHDYLRRGVISRRSEPGETVETASLLKLERFRKRWERLAGRPLSHRNLSPNASEPSAGERAFHAMTGAAIRVADGFIRVSFEFLPITWLKTYRLFKTWLVAHGNTRRPSLDRQFWQHSITIFAGFLLIAGAVAVDFATGPEIACGPLYLLPCALLALIVGRGWATIAALLCSAGMTICGEVLEHHYSLLSGLVLWNAAMRFVVFQAFVLLLDRIGRDFSSESNARQVPPVSASEPPQPADH